MARRRRREPETASIRAVTHDGRGIAALEGKTVFVRCDLNVPLDKDLKITDDTRIRAAIPTLEYLVENGAKVLVTSHLVRLPAPDASRQISLFLSRFR